MGRRPRGSVGGKMFCVFLLEAGRAATCSFKVDDERFLELTGVPGVIPAPYLARAKWVQVVASTAWRVTIWMRWCAARTRWWPAGLTKKLQRDLGIEHGRDDKAGTDPRRSRARTVNAQ